VKSLRVRTSINACPADVYSVLTDYENYNQWNPWLRVTSGQTVEGGYLHLRIRSWIIFLPLKYQHDKVEKPSVLHRTQVGWMRYLLSTKRERVIYTKTDGSSLYTTSLSFEGPLGPFMQLFIGRMVYQGIKKETVALKSFCEEHFNLAAPKNNHRQTRRPELTESKSGRIEIPDLELVRA
jgi:hypothetical protein